MKHLLLLVLLLLHPQASANERFPIQLTCEIGAYIMYVNLNQSEKESWWKLHESYRTMEYVPFLRKKYYGTENSLKKMEIADDVLSFIVKGKGRSKSQFFINPYTLGVTVTVPLDFYFGEFSGQCFTGFKAYDRQI
jgi:hypothetical protein